MAIVLKNKKDHLTQTEIKYIREGILERGNTIAAGEDISFYGPKRRKLYQVKRETACVVNISIGTNEQPYHNAGWSDRRWKSMNALVPFEWVNDTTGVATARPMDELAVPYIDLSKKVALGD